MSEQWIYNIDIENRYELANNTITEIKKIRYKKLKAQNQLLVQHKKIEDYIQISENDKLYEVLAEQEKQKLLFLEQDCNISESDFDERLNICNETIREYNKYIHSATDFLEKHNLTDINVQLLVNKDKMVEYIFRLFDLVCNKYDTYKTSNSNYIYKMLPFLKPYNWDKNQNDTKLDIVKRLTYIKRLTTHFPELQVHITEKYMLDYLQKQMLCISNGNNVVINNIIDGKMKKMLEHNENLIKTFVNISEKLKEQHDVNDIFLLEECK